MALYFYCSNSIDGLVKKYSLILKQNTKNDLFKSDAAVTQTDGMKQWIVVKCSEYNSVFANTNFYRPNQLFNEIFEKCNVKTNKDDLFDQENMKWNIFDILKDANFLKDINDHGESNMVRSYAESDNMKRYQLSQKIADLFDQYMTYRPEMIKAWQNNSIYKDNFYNENTKHQKWQKELFVRLYNKYDNVKTNVLMEDEFLASLKNNDIKKVIKDNYYRITFFGLSILNKSQVNTIAALSEITDIYLFMLNPCREYWYDILPEKKISYLKEKLGVEQNIMFEKGNSILADNGKTGRDIFNLFFKNDVFLNDFNTDLFEDYNVKTVLSILKSNILNLKQKQKCKPMDDKSIIINSASTKAREVEILYNNILDYIEFSNSDCKDILVMSPQIEDYIPFIKGVFDATDYNVPYYIADRGYFKHETISLMFEKISDIPFSNFTNEDIFEIAESKFIQDKFGFNDIIKLREVTESLNIRWAPTKSIAINKGNSESRFNSWEYGIERALLSFSVKDQNNLFDFYDDRYLINDNIEGNDIKQFLVFADFVNKLINVYETAIAQKKTTKEWALFFEQILNDFFDYENIDENEFSTIIKHINKIKKSCKNFNEKIEYGIVKDAVFSHLKRASRSGLLYKGITFSSMIPFRSIPFKMICLIGLNHDAFPRQTDKFDFDLIQKNELPGDRNVKNNDRYLFLETLLSAKHRLYISYIGRDVKDNSIKNPSILVDELIDYVNTNICINKDNKLQITSHPLYGFSKHYFVDNPNYFTYLEDNFYNKKEDQIVKDQKKNIKKDTGIDFEISLNEIINFFKSPVRWYYNNVLDIYFDDSKDALVLKEDEELELTDHLKEYLIKNDLLTKQSDDNEFILTKKLENMLPLSNMAQAKLKQIQEENKYIYEKYHFVTNKYEQISFEDELSIKIGKSYNLNIICNFTNCFKNLEKKSEMIHVVPCFGTMKAHYIIELWIKHLALKIYSIKNNTYSKSYFINEDKVKMIESDEKEAQNEFKKILSWYIIGKKRCLSFTKEAGLAYVQRKIFTSKDTRAKDPISFAKKAFENDTKYDDYVKKAFNGFFGTDNLQEFKIISNVIFRKPLELMKNEKKL